FCHCFILFFFQAEDGIRDFHVTGVQTCALPISMREPLVMMCSEAWVLDPRPALRPWATAGKMAAVGARPRGGTRKSFHWSANVPPRAPAKALMNPMRVLDVVPLSCSGTGHRRPYRPSV